MASPQKPKKPREQRLKKLSDKERAELDRIEFQAIADFVGDLHDLEAAIGMLRFGPHVGWKVLHIIHSKRTIRKYEEILAGDSKVPVRIKELFEPEGPSSYRSVGFQIVQKVSNFWKVINNESSEATLPKDKRHEMVA